MFRINRSRIQNQSMSMNKNKKTNLRLDLSNSIKQQDNKDYNDTSIISSPKSKLYEELNRLKCKFELEITIYRNKGTKKQETKRSNSIEGLHCQAK